MDSQPKRSLIDDPGFLLGLERLERGLPASTPSLSGSHGPDTHRSPSSPHKPSSPHTSNSLQTPSQAWAPGREIFYGAERPFGPSTDPKFFYQSVPHDRAAQEMLSAIRRRDAVVVITGAPGTGKTMLCQAIVEQLDRRTLTALVAEPLETPIENLDELLTSVLASFGVISREQTPAGRGRQTSAHDLGATLYDFLAMLASVQAFAVVFVDAAQKVPVDVLARFGALCESAGNGGSERLLQIVLVGESELLDRLGRPELRPLASRAIVRCRLEPLSSPDVAGYIKHRLSVGGNGRLEFDETAAEDVAALTAGIPRAINTLCDRAYALAYRSASKVIDQAAIGRAADDLGLALGGPLRSRPVSLGIAAAGLALLLGAAGAMAGLVFQDSLLRAVGRLERVPSPPAPPTRRALAGLTPLPPPRVAALGSAGSLTISPPASRPPTPIFRMPEQ